MANGIGERLRARAKELNLTDAEVARRLGLAQSRYAHYVSGSRAPDYQTLARICRALLTSPDQVLGFSAEDAGRTAEEDLLRERATAALGAMDTRSLRLAADVLDAIARGSEVDRKETEARAAPGPGGSQGFRTKVSVVLSVWPGVTYCWTRHSRAIAFAHVRGVRHGSIRLQAFHRD